LRWAGGRQHNERGGADNVRQAGVQTTEQDSGGNAAVAAAATAVVTVVAAVGCNGCWGSGAVSEEED